MRQALKVGQNLFTQGACRSLIGPSEIKPYFFSAMTSDNYPKLDQTWQMLKAQLSRILPLLQTPAPSSEVPRPPSLVTSWLHTQVFPKFNNLLEQLRILRRILYLKWQFYYSKKIQVTTSQRERHTKWCLGTKGKVSIVLSQGIQDPLPSWPFIE